MNTRHAIPTYRPEQGRWAYACVGLASMGRGMRASAHGSLGITSQKLDGGSLDRAEDRRCPGEEGD